uniref:G_PROTEIN_RECEP_F1_2 domain-containing protein n=1 Tax=Caenorhabditis tropicalis TaxID=1561998 RepID=A0A1I7UYQ2_9PELO
MKYRYQMDCLTSKIHLFFILFFFVSLITDLALVVLGVHHFLFWHMFFLSCVVAIIIPLFLMMIFDAIYEWTVEKRSERVKCQVLMMVWTGISSLIGVVPVLLFYRSQNPEIDVSLEENRTF